MIMKRFLAGLLILWFWLTPRYAGLTPPADRALAEGNSSHPTPEEIYYEELKKEYIPQKRPGDSFQLELKLMSDGMYCYDLDLFDPRWRKNGQRILTSPLFRKTASAYKQPFKVDIENQHAVIYFPDYNTLGPVFLYQDERGWIIDRTAVAEKVLYERKGNWVVVGEQNPYLNLLQKIYSLEGIPIPQRGTVGYRVRDAKK